MPTHFDDLAATWDDAPDKLERSRALAAAIVDALALDTSMTALDYGCGTGQLTWELAPHLDHITLADTSTGMLDVVRRRLADRPDADRFRALHLDLATDASPETYDLIYSALVLHHIDDTATILRALYASLKPGGWLAVADLDHDPENHYHGHDHDFDGHLGFQRDALAADAVAAGFDAPTFRTATTLTKDHGDGPHDFDLFLMTARRPA